MNEAEQARARQVESLRLARVMLSTLRRAVAAREDSAFVRQTYELLQRSSGKAIQLADLVQNGQEIAQEAEDIVERATKLLETYLNDESADRESRLRQLEKELAEVDRVVDERPTPR